MTVVVYDIGVYVMRHMSRLIIVRLLSVLGFGSCLTAWRSTLLLRYLTVWKDANSTCRGKRHGVLSLVRLSLGCSALWTYTLGRWIDLWLELVSNLWSLRGWRILNLKIYQRWGKGLLLIADVVVDHGVWRLVIVMARSWLWLLSSLFYSKELIKVKDESL